ncbi:hypothetical protein BGZ65_004540 [Modicella reniformis]|uniref:Uncharacterized protein n=1 Tax=Modicella reniformis TaxID=1440133 RepID=A0A9P6J5U4_9FUNG|nr:hypothetical protein BGZ65_004540 [Modicella reniformis]
MREYSSFTPASPLAISPVQFDPTFHDTPSSPRRSMSPIGGAASVMKNFLRRRRGTTLIIANNATTDKVNDANKYDYALPKAQPSMTFVFVGGYDVIPGTTTIIYDSELSETAPSEANTPVLAVASLHTPAKTSTLPSINDPVYTSPSFSSSSTTLFPSTLEDSDNSLLAVVAAVSAHRKLLSRGSRSLSVDGLLLNSDAISVIEEEDEKEIVTVEILDSHDHGKNQSEDAAPLLDIAGSTPTDASVPEISNDADEEDWEGRVSTEFLNWTLEASNLPDDSFKLQFRLEDVIKTQPQEEQDDEEEDEEEQDHHIYDSSENLLADYLTYNNDDNQEVEDSPEDEIMVLEQEDQPTSDDTLFSDCFSPTQFFDAPQTRNTLRSFLGGAEHEFDEMIEHGFPTGATNLPEHQQQQDGQATDGRYSTLRITLTPWHARADELELYGQSSGSVEKQTQFKSMVNKFFSRSSQPISPTPPPASSCSQRPAQPARTHSDSSVTPAVRSDGLEFIRHSSRVRSRTNSPRLAIDIEKTISNTELLTPPFTWSSLPMVGASNQPQSPRKGSRLALTVSFEDQEECVLRSAPVTLSTSSDSDMSLSEQEPHLDSGYVLASSSSLTESSSNGNYLSTKMENTHPVTPGNYIGMHYGRSTPIHHPRKGSNQSDITIVENPMGSLDSWRDSSSLTSRSDSSSEPGTPSLLPIRRREKENEELTLSTSQNQTAQPQQQRPPRRSSRYPFQQHVQYQEQVHRQQQQALAVQTNAHNNAHVHNHSVFSPRMPASALSNSMRAPGSPVQSLYSSAAVAASIAVNSKEQQVAKSTQSRQGPKLFGFSLRGKDKRDTKPSETSSVLPRINTKGWRGRDQFINANVISGPMLCSPYDCRSNEDALSNVHEQAAEAYFETGMDNHYKGGKGYYGDQFQQKKGGQAQGQGKENHGSSRNRQQHEDIVNAIKACGM